MRRPEATHCSGCGVKKTDKNTHRRTGVTKTFQSLCKKCGVAQTKRWRARDVIGALYAGAKSRAKRKGLPFNIEKTDLTIPNVCPVLGIPLFANGGKRTDNTPTVDRIVTALGYVKGNVAVISWRANRLKNDATPEELRLIHQFVAANVPRQSKSPSGLLMVRKVKPKRKKPVRRVRRDSKGGQ